MKKWEIYTPDGVSDILFDRCSEKRKIEAELRKLFVLSGYRELETPTLEFYDVFGGDHALLRQEQMYKLTDSQGRLLVLKPDMTIPVARVIATQFKNPVWPMKCCYIGNTFSSDEIGGGRQNEFTQAGVEVFGAHTPEADAEIIATAVRSILATGLVEFQIDIGEVEFFRGIMEESGLSEEEIEEIRYLIDRKDYVAVEEVVELHQIECSLKQLILDLPKLFGSKEIVERLEGQQIGLRAKNALEYLKKVLDIVDDRGLSKYVSVDLGMVQSLNYYTGIVFRGYTYGIGFPILSGGRYNNLVSRFGLDCPATGFSMGINLVMMALEHQHLSPKSTNQGVFVTYEPGCCKAAVKICESFQQEGRIAEMNLVENSLAKSQSYARMKGYNLLLNVKRDGEVEEVVLESFT